MPGDDYYWALLVNYKYPIYCIKEALYSYRMTPNSITNSLTSNRMLIIPEILQFLKNEVIKNGEDIVTLSPEKILAYEEKLLADKKYISQKLCTWAAMSIDKNEFVEARKLLKEAFSLAPLSFQNLKTVRYYLMKKYFTS
jgi:hypothetical protein